MLLELATMKSAAWRALGRLCLQPLVTAIILSVFYAGFFVVREGSIGSGLRTAFLDSRAAIATRERDIQAAMMQAELRHAAASDVLISQLLQSLLAKAPGAARVRLGVIHNGITGLTGMSLLKFDITNSIAAPGRASGDLVANDPLSGWAGFLGKLLAGDCTQYATADLAPSPEEERLERLGGGAILVCPVTDIRNQMLGALFLQWDRPADVPASETRDATIAAAKLAGSHLATALDLKTVRQ